MADGKPQAETGGQKAAGKKKENVSDRDRSSHIVALGSSAGGLEALEEFFRHMSAGSGLAFVVISHLDPNHKSLLSELLGKYTTMDVAQVEDGMEVRADHVYVIPPNSIMSIENGVLRLVTPDEPRGQRHPIDLFFRSLAEDQADRAIGIVLSGTGTEGALGLKAIQGAGGLAIVQDPDTAKFDGMPRNAIKTGQIDYILPAKDIPARLIDFTKDLYNVPLQVQEAVSEDKLHKIHMLIRKKTGHDFSKYKPKTILRRIERRMVLHQFDDLDKYIRFLRETPTEIDKLFQELLIRVTNFFRDPLAFKALGEKALPVLFGNLKPGEEIRVWVTGCSTGEEAYSLAIILTEYLNKNDLAHSIKVFATDIDKKAIHIARAGIYPESISEDVSPARLKRYFIRKDNSYQVNKNIREMVIFAEQDVLQDPPFSRMDLICCRNLLIYLGGELQKKVFTVFHYALKPGGMIFLGASESLGYMADSFAPIDTKWKIWQIRKKAGKGPRPDLAPFPDSSEPAPAAHPAPERKKEPVEELAGRLLLQMYAPPCVLVDNEGTIIYFHGRTGRYLEPSPGIARLHIMAMARSGLRKYLERAIRTVRITGKEVVHTGISVDNNGGSERCDLKVRLVRDDEGQGNLLMVIFEESATAAAPAAQTGPSSRKTGKRAAELEGELRSVKEQLQTTIEELETANEELQSANEELQSSNEELQSTNEELEVSREELQSLNEEQMSSNAELQDKIGELYLIKDDMNNLLSAIEIATVFLDGDLRVRRFTPSAIKHFKLIDSDVNRPLSDIVSSLEYGSLESDARAVLQDLVPKALEVRDNMNKWYQVKILPYRTLQNRIDGLVLTFVDISRVKLAELSLLKAEKRYSLVFEKLRDGIVLLDAESGTVLDANSAFCRQTGLAADKIRNMKFWELTAPGHKQTARKLIAAICKKEEADFEELSLRQEGGGKVKVDVAGQLIVQQEKKYIQIISIEK